MVTEIEVFESGAHYSLHFCLCVCTKSEVYKRKVDKPDELLACILDAAARMKEREDQHRRTTRDLRTRIAKVHWG
jgi:hypothetical protein